MSRATDSHEIFSLWKNRDARALFPSCKRAPGPLTPPRDRARTRVGGSRPFRYCHPMQTVPTRSVALALFGAVLFAGCTNEGPTKPVISTFTCTPTTLPGGAGPVTLSWAVSGAISLTIEPTVGAVSPVSYGSTTVQVTASTTFTLTATGLNGSSTATCQVSVTQVPVITSFTATPSTYPAGGGPVVLAWNVTGATTLTIDQGVDAVTPPTVGNKTVLVGATTTFTLTAMDSAGRVLETAMVTVLPPVVNPTVNGTVVDIGGQPAAGETVVITSGAFSQTVVSDSNGAFTVPAVPSPYNATVIQSTQAIQYQGLTPPSFSLPTIEVPPSLEASPEGPFPSLLATRPNSSSTRPKPLGVSETQLRAATPSRYLGPDRAQRPARSMPYRFTMLPASRPTTRVTEP